MKYTLTIIGLLSVCLSCSPTQKANEPGNGATAIDGAWEMVGSTLDGQQTQPYRPQQLKIFHDGFFSFTHYNSDGSFNGSGSGTYTLNGNQFKETFRFYSDTVWVGYADLQTWELRGDTLIFAGFKKVFDRSGKEMPPATWGAISSSRNASGLNPKYQYVMPTTFPFLPALGIVCCLLTPALKATAQISPEVDIMTVMRAKAEAYFTGDLKKLQSFCVQDSSNSRTIVTKSYYSSQTGWPNVLAALTQDIQEDGINSVTVTHENVHIRTSGNLAFVEADERYAGPGIDPKEIPVFRVYNVLVKEKTGWKTANTVRVDPASFANTPANREYELNAIGYDLLREKRISEAVDLFNLNVRLNPNSWNAYDSLGEAYALSGQTALAIANYEKSLVLNPQNDNAKTVLDGLTKRTR